MLKMKIGIIVPVYNEQYRAVSTIDDILKNTKNLVIVIDDGSIDDSYKILKENFSKNKRVFILRHALNLGKGAAMKTGVKMAWKLGLEAVIFLDADGQHNPVYLPKFEKALKENDLVFGCRGFGLEMPLIRKWGNIFAINLIKLLFNIKRKDLLCGFIGFRKSVYNLIKWDSGRYGVETEIATKVGKNKLPFKEIEIDTIYIDKYKGVNIFDALKILTKIPCWYFLN